MRRAFWWFVAVAVTLITLPARCAGFVWCLLVAAFETGRDDATRLADRVIGGIE